MKILHAFSIWPNNSINKNDFYFYFVELNITIKSIPRNIVDDLNKCNLE